RLRPKDPPAMLPLTRTVHVLVLGLWFGTTVFFSFVVGLRLFSTFEELAKKDAAESPLWFPLPDEYKRERPSDTFPEPLRKEQGTRAAGYGVSPMFAGYYGIQTGCGLLALATALTWLRAPEIRRLNRVRAVLLLVALITVGVGWWLDVKVEALRGPRNDKTDAVLRNPQPSSQEIREAEEARATFGQWHGYSLLVNFGTLALVTVATGMAATLPGGPRQQTLPAPA